LIKRVKEAASVDVLVALKAFANWGVFSIFKKYGYDLNAMSAALSMIFAELEPDKKTKKIDIKVQITIGSDESAYTFYTNKIYSPCNVEDYEMLKYLVYLGQSFSADLGAHIKRAYQHKKSQEAPWGFQRVEKQLIPDLKERWISDLICALQTKGKKLSDIDNLIQAKSQLEDVLNNGMPFDGSAIEGFVRIYESDMIAMPDPTTFRILPWRPNERKEARIIFLSGVQLLIFSTSGYK
jgi:hypothetical protein